MAGLGRLPEQAPRAATATSLTRTGTWVHYNTFLRDPPPAARADGGGAAAYLREDVQLAHDVLQRAGQRLRRAAGLPQTALRRLLAPASARGDGHIRFRLQAVRERGPSVRLERLRDQTRNSSSEGLCGEPPANMRE